MSSPGGARETALLRVLKFSFSKSSEEKRCPSLEEKRKFRLHRVSGDGKGTATAYLWALGAIAGAGMNGQYSNLYLSIPVHVTSPWRDLWSLAFFVNTCIADRANKFIWKQELEVRRCVPQYISSISLEGQITPKDEINPMSQTEKCFGKHRMYCQKLNYQPFAWLSHSNPGILFRKNISQLKS